MSAFRSVLAVAAGFVAIVVLSLATDMALRAAGIFPPRAQRMENNGLLALATLYRSVYGALGSFLAGKLAPRNPMRHAMLLGGIGFVLAIAGAVAAIPMKLGPLWYPIALVLTALPCAWLGGRLAGPRGTI